MPPKKEAPKNSRLDVAVSLKDRALIVKAAKILELPPSVWVRALAIKEAMRIVSEARSSNPGSGGIK